MTRHYIFGLLFFTTAILLGSCYKDKGNYDYQDINQVVLKTDQDVVNVLLPDSLKVTLTLEQTMPDPVGFSFEWVLYTASGVAQTRRTLDTTQNLKARIIEMPGSYYLMLYAKDRKTGVEFQKRLVVNVLTAYSEGWIVVEENNGACDLSMITPIDTIFRNIYSASNNGQKLPSGTNRIPDIKTFNNDQKVFVISPADMIQVNYSDFKKIVNFKEFFWRAPDPKPQEYFANSFDEMMLNNGKVHCRSLNAPAGPNYLSLPAEGDHYFAPYEIYPSSGGYVAYDTISQQFFKLNTSTAVLTPFNNPPGSADFYMNKIGKKLIYTEINAGNFNAFFKNNNDDSLFAFEYDPTKANPAIRRFNGLFAPHMIDARLFVSSRRFMHLYYAYDNMIYKLDITAGTAVPIYTFPAGAEIRAMKMYRNLKNSSHPDHNNLIAVATHENGEGKVYYFPIAATGNFTNNTYRKVFTGFNKINEITFKSLK